MSSDQNEFQQSQRSQEYDQSQQYDQSNQNQQFDQNQQYGQGQPYGQTQQYGQGGYPPAEDPGKTLGIVGFILAFVAAPAGIVVSAISKKKSREAGFPVQALAKWGFILGIIFTILWVLYIVVIIAATMFAVQNGVAVN